MIDSGGSIRNGANAGSVEDEDEDEDAGELFWLARIDGHMHVLFLFLVWEIGR